MTRSTLQPINFKTFYQPNTATISISIGIGIEKLETMGLKFGMDTSPYTENEA